MTVSTLRPNGQAFLNGWNGNAGETTNLHNKVNDDSDTTYVKGTKGYPAASGRINFDLGTVAPSATQRILRVRVAVRAAHEGTDAGYEQISATLKDPIASKPGSKVAAPLTCQPRDIFKQSPPQTIKRFNGIWRTADPVLQEWKAVVIGRLQAEFYAYQSSKGLNNFFRVYEVYVDVDIRDQPTVSGVTQTFNATSSRPQIDWTYTPNADDDPQVAYRLKIFSAAQYGAAGFDPETSPPTFDSGEVASQATSTTVGADLTNGVTYKAYVKAAQDFNGSRWYSAWANSAAFSETFEAVPQPTLTVTADNTVPHLRNRLSVDAKLNLLSADDASFEGGLGTHVNDTNATLVQDATQFLKGVKSMRLTATIAAAMAAKTGAYPAAPNQSYTFLGSFRAGTLARSCRLKVRWQDNDGVQIGAEVVGSSVADSNAAWTQATLAATSPAGTAQVVIVEEVLAPAAAEQHFLDAVSYSTSSSTTWFAGGLSTLDLQLVEFTDWTPASSVVVNVLSPQLASCGALVGNTDGFYKRFTKDLLTLDRSDPFVGETAIRWDVGQAAFSFLDIGAPQGVYEPTYTPACVAGRTYTLSGWAKAKAGSHTCKLFLFPIDQTGAQVGASTEVNSGNQTVDTTYRRLSCTITPPAGTIGLRPGFENTNGDLAQYLLSGLQLEEGSVATPWQQGQGQIPAWQPVRGAKTALLADQRTNLADIWDREAPPGVIRMYRATSQVNYPDGTVGVSPVSTFVSTQLNLPVSGGQPCFILKDPQNPTHDLVATLQAMGERIAEDASELHPIRPNAPQGFGQRPIIISDWIGGDDGTLEFRVTDEAVWYPLKQLLRARTALLLQFPDGGQRYVRFKERSWPRDRIGPDPFAVDPSLFMRIVSVDFVEVDRPVVLA